MNLSIFLPLISSIFVFVLGLFIFFKNYKNKVNRIFLIFSLATFVWLFSTAMMFASTSDEMTMFWDKVAYSAIIFIPILLYHFSLIFTQKYSLPRKIFLVVGYLLACIFLITLLFTPYFVEGVYHYSWGAHSQARLFHHFFLGFFFAYLLAMFYILMHAYFSERDYEKRSRIGMVIISILILSIGSVGFLSAYGVNVYPFAYLSGTIFVAIVAYAISKYQLLHIKTFTVQILIILLIIIAFVDIFIARTTGEFILRFLFFITILFLGYLTMRSTNKEIDRKNELQKMTDKLGRANDELRKLDNAKSEFISIASHQLRTPLTAIKGYISLILEGSYGQVEPKLRDALNKVYLANERLIQLVEDLLNISRIESGRLEYKFDFHRMEDLVNELYDAFVLRARDKGLEFAVKKPRKPLPPVEMDYSKIREVISNLIDNAIKYTEEGRVTVIIEKHFNTIRVTVSDTGIGVPKELVNQLFEKFSRGKDTNRLHVEGTGLGLYVGRNLVDAHHGRMWVESAGSGRGAKFIVDLPLEQPRETHHRGVLEGFPIEKEERNSKK